jgi:hypothetical protein
VSERLLFTELSDVWLMCERSKDFEETVYLNKISRYEISSCKCGQQKSMSEKLIGAKGNS